MNQLEQIKQEVKEHIEGCVSMHHCICSLKYEQRKDLYGDEAISTDIYLMVADNIDKAYQAGKMENPCIEHCSEPSCPECNMAAYKAGQQAERERILKSLPKSRYGGTDADMMHDELLCTVKEIINLINNKE